MSSILGLAHLFSALGSALVIFGIWLAAASLILLLFFAVCLTVAIIGNHHKWTIDDVINCASCKILVGFFTVLEVVTWLGYVVILASCDLPVVIISIILNSVFFCGGKIILDRYTPDHLPNI